MPADERDPKASPQIPADWMTKDEAAKLMGKSRKTVERLCRVWGIPRDKVPVKGRKPVPIFLRKAIEKVMWRDRRVPVNANRNVRRDVFNLPEGAATLEWLEVLGPESIEGFAAWLGIERRKIERPIAKKGE